MTTDERIAEATRRGKKAGEARGSWVFDGNTKDETYQTTLQGIEDGDPLVLDALSWSPLSGEWAGESITELLGDLLEDMREDEAAEDDEDELLAAYETAAEVAYWDAIESTCRTMLEKDEEPKEDKLAAYRGTDGKLSSFAWPGGYPLFYITEDGATVCPDCANKETSDDARYADVNWEDTSLTCDDCGKTIPSAYGDA